VFSWGVLAPHTPLPSRCVISPWAYSCGSGDILFNSSVQQVTVPSGTFRLNTRDFLTIVPGMYAGPILSMVHGSPSVSNNLFSGLYAEVCGMGHISMYTN